MSCLCRQYLPWPGSFHCWLRDRCWEGASHVQASPPSSVTLPHSSKQTRPETRQTVPESLLLNHQHQHQPTLANITPTPSFFWLPVLFCLTASSWQTHRTNIVILSLRFWSFCKSHNCTCTPLIPLSLCSSHHADLSRIFLCGSPGESSSLYHCRPPGMFLSRDWSNQSRLHSCPAWPTLSISPPLLRTTFQRRQSTRPSP